MKTGISGAVSAATLALTLGVAIPGWAQEKVGIVTTAIGPVTVARASLPPEPLKFKDDVFLRDRVTTGEAAITRILLGGKVVVTARERSTLTITETPGLSTIHLTGGRIAVAVEKSRMQPGERVDIRTPNAVAGVRGTVLIVEAEGNVSTVTVLRGLVHVTRLDPTTGATVGRFTAVGARQTVTVRANVLPARSKSISIARADELSQEFTPPLRAMTAPAVVFESDEIRRVLATSGASVPPATIDAAAAAIAPAAVATVSAPTAAATPPLAPTPAAVAMPGVATAPIPAVAPVAAPAVSSPPVASITPTLPVAVAVPVVTAPAPVPTVSKTTSPNWGSSWKSLKVDKLDKDDRSGSNSGRR
jgi:hypothetical protein